MRAWRGGGRGGHMLSREKKRIKRGLALYDGLRTEKMGVVGVFSFFFFSFLSSFLFFF